MPSYAKFLKELLMRKRKYVEKETIEVQGNCSAIIQRKLPPKLQDPGSFTIPCTIGELEVGKALIDLGASINLMPLSMFRKIRGLELKPTRMTLQLADRSLKYPFGVTEDVIVKNGKLKVRVQDEEVNFDVFQAMSYPRDKKSCFQRDIVEELCMMQDKRMRNASALKRSLVNENEDLHEEEEKMIEECVRELEEMKEIPIEEVSFERIDSKKKVKESKLELKELPPHLKYVFLEAGGQKPFIISKLLSPKEEEKLVEVLKVIEKLPPPSNVKGIQSFLGHAGFYRRFIKNFSKIAKPLSNLLVKDAPFEMSSKCSKALDVLKKSLISASVIVAPDWTKEFELMCHASDYAIGAVMGQRREKVFHAIYYASKVLNEAQLNYATTEKELLAIVYALEKFRSYLIGSKVIVYTYHAAIKYLLTNPYSKPWLIRWVLFLQEFDIEIRDKKGSENLMANHLSRLVNTEVTSKEKEVWESFSDETLLYIQQRPWFADMANFKVAGVIPKELNWQ
ncbi:uncharacterized protein LOC106754484 [Vigna radiata var. radiata]|uniref:RNA-directed DNA polymerase n=1 Tax=Vigna radiata var. radiata TaxID=3916 RepID=A0A1S3TDZ4_VIGRR|nr:uncharacterized protein LOC106754484 [Vigna radiata var. radiata]